MLLGFKTELKVNKTQKILLAQHAGVARHAWNWGLKLTKDILDNNQNKPEDKIKFPTSIDLHKWLVAKRKTRTSLVLLSIKMCAPICPKTFKDSLG